MNCTIDRTAGRNAGELDEFHTDVLTDAVRAAEVYWKNYLWRRTHEEYRPSASLCERYAALYGSGGVEELWNGWFATLTSDDCFVILAGVDMERVGDAYGRSSHRT
jgi:hypothetical protein